MDDLSVSEIENLKEELRATARPEALIEMDDETLSEVMADLDGHSYDDEDSEFSGEALSGCPRCGWNTCEDLGSHSYCANCGYDSIEDE